MRPSFYLVLIAATTFPTSGWSAETASMGTMIMKMSWALAVVVGLILILYGLARKRMGYTNSPANSIKVLEMRPLMPKNTLALVEVQGKQILLGISTNGIQLLTELPPNGTPQKPFKEVLQENQ